MAEPVRARRLSGQEGQRLQQIVRRGRHDSVKVRRAPIIMASASGTPVTAIATLVAAHEDTVRDVIHAFNEKGLAALDPQWAGGRPRQINDEDIEFVLTTATTRPEKLGRPFTHWSLRKLADYLGENPTRPVQIGRRIEEVTTRFPDRCFAFDQFGPLSIRPSHGVAWAKETRPLRLPAIYHRTHGIRYFHGCYSMGGDQLWASPAAVRAATTLWPRSSRSGPPARTAGRST